MTKTELSFLASNLASTDIAIILSCCDTYLYDNWDTVIDNICMVDLAFNSKDVKKFCDCINKRIKFIIKETIGINQLEDFDIYTLGREKTIIDNLKFSDFNKYLVKNKYISYFEFVIENTYDIHMICFRCQFSLKNEKILIYQRKNGIL